MGEKTIAERMRSREIIGKRGGRERVEKMGERKIYV